MTAIQEVQELVNAGEFQPHPLLIDHVVENILTSLDSDLLGHYCKIFRLVCKDWSRISTRVYKAKRGRIVFKRNFIGKVSGLFIRVMKTSSNIPFERFKFCSDSYDNEYFIELLHVCSGAIHNLDLNLVNPCNLKFPINLSNLILGNLRTLIFHVRLDSFQPIQTEMHSLLQTLFEISPNLQSLDLKVLRGVCRSPLHNQQSLNAQEKFGDVLAKHLPDGIRHLKIHITLNESQILEMTKRKLNFTSIDIYLQQSEVSSQALEQLFTKCAPKLKNCKVLGNQFMKQVKFPVFSSLKTLSALGRAPKYLSYQKLFPVLNKLEICLWDSFDDIFPPNCFSSSLTHVEIPYNISSPEIIHRMGSCFPNLKKLTGVFVSSEEALVAIFQSLRKLEVLDMVLGYDFQTSAAIDPIITGIRDCTPVIKYNEELVKEELRSKKGSYCYSIRSLKELRHLSILAAPLTRPSSVKLTDISVYYAFLQLENLVSINIDYFPISSSCLEILQKSVCLKRPI